MKYTREEEEKYLSECKDIIRTNIARFEFDDISMSSEIKEMFDHFHDDNPEMYTQLANLTTMHDMVAKALRKSRRAFTKPYFGRIDYLDRETAKKDSLYIGKQSVMKNNTTLVVIDWRAPVSTVYYESQLGECSYAIPEGKQRPIDLTLKRTYEIDEKGLIDYYDTDVVANDELLTKYLAKNKEQVLSEIIATIQKEQNDIIRKTPFHNVIVQGVAGSGKTTVAMHRISYIMYNYSERFRPSEFYVIGSNKMLLTYITGVLPDLDVDAINQMTLDHFFELLLTDELDKKKYRILKNTREEMGENKAFSEYKGSLSWLNDLEAYVRIMEHAIIPSESVSFDEEVLYSAHEFKEFMKNNRSWSTQEKIDSLNQRLMNRLKNYLSMKEREYEKEELRLIYKKYQNRYGAKKWNVPMQKIYLDFALHKYEKAEGTIRSGLEHLISNLQKKETVLDVYDLASLLFLKRKVKETAIMEDADHIVVDEAQDYGVMVFAAIKTAIPKCTFTIMGDVSQNINYDSGMNDWESLRKTVFDEEQDYFGILAKSYRNTIEISDYAGKVLKHCSFETYKTEPIIRHGREVEIIHVNREDELVTESVKVLSQWENAGFDTMAVICRDTKECEAVRKQLGRYLKVNEGDLAETVFSKGIMVLPIHLTKGLEFDTVLLWNPESGVYPVTDANAKLLYVAATRALHELTLICHGKLSGLLDEKQKEL